MSITVYTFEGPQGNTYTGEWSTQDYAEAEAYASKNGYRIIGNEYEWSDSEVIADYTGDEADAAGDED